MAGSARRFSTIGCSELDGEMLRVAAGAAVAHREHAPALADARGERLGAGGERRRVRLEEARSCVAALSRAFLRMRLPIMRPGPSVLEVGGAGALGRHHRRAERRLRRALLPNAGQSHGFLMPRRIEPADAARRTRASRWRRPRRGARRRGRGTRRAADSPTSGSAPTPRHLRSATSKTSKTSSRAGAVAVARDHARVLVLDGGATRSRAAARTSGCPRADRPARSR